MKNQRLRDSSHQPADARTSAKPAFSIGYGSHYRAMYGQPKTPSICKRQFEDFTRNDGEDAPIRRRQEVGARAPTDETPPRRYTATTTPCKGVGELVSPQLPRIEISGHGAARTVNGAAYFCRIRRSGMPRAPGDEKWKYLFSQRQQLSARGVGRQQSSLHVISVSIEPPLCFLDDDSAGKMPI